VRAAALSLRDATASDPSEVVRSAQEALRTSCWRLQAQATKVLAKRGVRVGGEARLPSFLRSGAASPRR
jgi:hypothetical protein